MKCAISAEAAEKPLSLSEFAGAPRSVAWQGGALHLRASHGGGVAPDPHAHFAIQLSIAMSGELTLRTGPRAAPKAAPGWLIGSDRWHGLFGRGAVVTVFWDPVSDDGQRGLAHLGGRAIAALAPEACGAIRGRLQELWARGWRLPELRAAAHELAVALAPAAVHRALDARVRAVLERMARDPSANTSLAELASGVGLSESRLAHLFRDEVGIPMRQYRLSLRMEDTVRAIARGRSLTEAAHAAGFADSAHLCRICRRMYGTAPSNLPTFETGA